MNAPLRARLRSIAHSPALFLRDIAPLDDAVVLSPMSEESYRASSFLDTRLVRAGDRDLGLPIATLQRLLAAQAARRRTIHWLFHVGHCGSTLLARLLGELDGLFALREPAVVMGLTRSARRLDEPGFPIGRDRWRELEELALTLLGRTWRPTQTALVKATSDAVSLCPELLRFTGDERALMLYVDLETFVATMLRPHTRRELRLFAQDFRIDEFRRLVPAAPAAATDYSDGRLAALSWLLHVRHMAAALDDPALAGRVRGLDFDDYLADPAAELGRLADFFGCPQPPATLAALAAGELASTYAKGGGTRYEPARRTAELADSRRRHREEIDDAVDWVRAVAAGRPDLAPLATRFARSRVPPARP